MITKDEILSGNFEFRTIFISDTHLGSKFAKTGNLLEFLKFTESKKLFLVGDIIDGWAIRRKMRWHQECSDTLQKILRKARKGTEVFYIVGNHDEFLRDFLPLYLGNSIQILNKFEYFSAKDERFLVTHGDYFDTITVNRKWLAHLGDRAYELLLSSNEKFGYIKRKMGIKSQWSLSMYVEDNVKASMNYIGDFEAVLTSHARRYDYDGVICGHIHRPAIKELDGVRYLNSGDWVENCTALVELNSGEFRLVKWA